MDIEHRKTLATEPIIWTGDLDDDCTAIWAGLMLRAERMEEDYWWWAVYDMTRGDLTIDDSNSYKENFTGGVSARKKAETVALHFIAIVTQKPVAKYTITDTFKITGRGLVIAGYITEGLISTGDTIEFATLGYLMHRQITGVEFIRKQGADMSYSGLLIKCNDDHEITELAEWVPAEEPAMVFPTHAP
jgi:hypothetical protein